MSEWKCKGQYCECEAKVKKLEAALQAWEDAIESEQIVVRSVGENRGLAHRLRQTGKAALLDRVGEAHKKVMREHDKTFKKLGEGE